MQLKLYYSKVVREEKLYTPAIIHCDVMVHFDKCIPSL